MLFAYQQPYSGWIPAPEARCWSRRGLLVLDAPGERLCMVVVTGRDSVSAR